MNVLQLRGYTVLEASTGRSALELADHHAGPIHLLLTDVAMPELDGLALATKLRERRSGLAVLYVSGYAEDAERVSESLGEDTYFLAKPFLPGELTRRVWSILESERES